jgi:hypothetical protein
MAGVERYQILTARQQVLRCKKAAARQLALLRGGKLEDETMRRSKRLADATQRFEATEARLRAKRQHKHSLPVVPANPAADTAAAVLESRAAAANLSKERQS